MNPDALRTVKVDRESMEILARKSLLEGPPASVAFDPDDKTSYRAAVAGFVCLAVAFMTGALLHVLVARAEPPALPPPVRAHVVPVVLRAVELPPPRSEAPRLLHRPAKPRPTKSELSKPLFDVYAHP